MLVILWFGWYFGHLEFLGAFKSFRMFWRHFDHLKDEYFSHFEVFRDIFIVLEHSSHFGVWLRISKLQWG